MLNVELLIVKKSYGTWKGDGEWYIRTADGIGLAKRERGKGVQLICHFIDVIDIRCHD